MMATKPIQLRSAMPFSFRPDEAIAAIQRTAADTPTGAAGFERRTADVQLSAVSVNGGTYRNDEVANQFMVFQLSRDLEGPALLEASDVEPDLEGDHAAPDIRCSLNLMSLHVARSVAVDSNDRATMRITFGKDPESSSRIFDTVFWSAAVGLKLFDQIKNKKPEPRELKTDLHAAFNHRPIEIPGGLGLLQFEVVRHEEPQWWQRIFRFARSGTGEALTAALGFPAITHQAIGVLDELLNRLIDTKPQVLFGSRPLRLALTKFARDEFTAGNPRVRAGCMNRGWSVLARGEHYGTLVKQGAVYYPHLDRLVPGDVSEAEVISGSYEDPFTDITYAVFRIGMSATKLDPTFDYGG